MAQYLLITACVYSDDDIDPKALADYIAEHIDGTGGGVSLFSCSGELKQAWDIDVADAEIICNNIMKAHPDDADGIAFGSTTYIQVVEVIRQWIKTTQESKGSDTICVVWDD
jgi:hypothetical protein